MSRLRRAMGRVWPPWEAVALLCAAVVVFPVASVLSHVGADTDGLWGDLAETVLGGYLANTGWLLLGVGAGTLVLGVSTAWLVTVNTFPGSRLLSWALLLPLAVPAYLVAYTMTDLLQFSGPVQTALREWTGWGRGDYYFPPVRSVGGAVLVLSLALYPYVYLLSRAAFLEQSACVLEAGRTLGRGPWGTFFSVALPLARPGIVAGLSLALMETLADFGAVSYFAVDTFTTGIYRAWTALASPAAAAQLASILLLFVFTLVVLERWNRGARRYHPAAGRTREMTAWRLRGWRAVAAAAWCALPVLGGFVIPVVVLLGLARGAEGQAAGAGLAELARNSLTLAAVTALTALLAGVFIAYGNRLRAGTLLRVMTRVVPLGYALPGTLVAVGVFGPLAWLDNRFADAWESLTGVDVGLVFTGSIACLVAAYLVRLLAVALNAVEAGLGRISPAMDASARTLGCGPGGVLWRVHRPLMGGSLCAAALLVFVDVMKELPATLIARPFNFDTLAVRVYTLAEDERLAQAAVPALMIVAVGIIPVVLLCRAAAGVRGRGPGREMPADVPEAALTNHA